MNYQLTIDAFIGPWAYSKQFVRNVLASHKGKHVDVKISSLGGNLDHGLDIRQQFIDHGDVTVYLSGFVASAATVIAMGAKRIVMSKYAMFLVHKCSNFIDAWGNYNSDQMQQLINELEENKKENDKIDVVLANMYASNAERKFRISSTFSKRAGGLLLRRPSNMVSLMKSQNRTIRNPNLISLTKSEPSSTLSEYRPSVLNQTAIFQMARRQRPVFLKVSSMLLAFIGPVINLLTTNLL